MSWMKFALLATPLLLFPSVGDAQKYQPTGKQVWVLWNKVHQGHYHATSEEVSRGDCELCPEADDPPCPAGVDESGSHETAETTTHLATAGASYYASANYQFTNATERRYNRSWSAAWQKCIPCVTCVVVDGECYSPDNDCFEDGWDKPTPESPDDCDLAFPAKIAGCSPPGDDGRTSCYRPAVHVHVVYQYKQHTFRRAKEYRKFINTGHLGGGYWDYKYYPVKGDCGGYKVAVGAVAKERDEEEPDALPDDYRSPNTTTLHYPIPAGTHLEGLKTLECVCDELNEGSAGPGAAGGSSPGGS